MAFDLMFTHKKLAYSEARSPDFQPDSKELKARNKLLKALAAEFELPAQAALSTAPPEHAGAGCLEGFPIGELHVNAGYLHGILHADVATHDIQKIVDWFNFQDWL